MFQLGELQYYNDVSFFFRYTCTHSNPSSLVKIGNNDVVYVSRKAIYWLRKGNKQPVLLKTEEDLETCKTKYGTGSIRIACTVVNVSNSSPGICMI